MDKGKVKEIGELYREGLLDGLTTERGTKANNEYNDGPSPKEYLLMRGWIDWQDPDLPFPTSYEDIIEGWTDAEFEHPMYNTRHSLKDALLIQLKQDIESLGGFHRFLDVVCERGVPAAEMEW